MTLILYVSEPCQYLTVILHFQVLDYCAGTYSHNHDIWAEVFPRVYTNIPKELRNVSNFGTFERLLHTKTGPGFNCVLCCCSLLF